MAEPRHLSFVGFDSSWTDYTRYIVCLSDVVRHGRPRALPVLLSHGNHDSTYGGSEGTGMSASLASTVFDYVYENGRRYHRFREGAYALPNDEQEQERLDMLHHIFRLILKGALYTAPITNPQNVLDFGTGTGIWALDFADEHPSAEVLGTDLSPIQPTWIPANCRFMIDDAESDWEYPKPFDYIHQRNMVGSFSDWERLYRQAYDHLAPGGWFEAQEFEIWFFNEGDPLPADTPVFEWPRLLDEASSKFGKRLRCIEEMKDAFQKAGFVDVAHDVYKIPIGRWADDKDGKELGMYLQAQLFDSVEGVSMALFTRVLGWTKEQTLEFGERVRKDLGDDSKRLYGNCHFLRGRKPKSEEVTGS